MEGGAALSASTFSGKSRIKAWRMNTACEVLSCRVETDEVKCCRQGSMWFEELDAEEDVVLLTIAMQPDVP